MSTDATSPAWLIYERCVAAFVSEGHSDIDTTVLPNVTLRGEISSELRQVDVLIDHRWPGGAASRIIVDAKRRARPIDIGDVEQFEGMMRDCRASRGIIVCTAGWTKGAEKRAQRSITITLLEYESAIDEYGWIYDECLGLCQHENKGRHGGVLWGEYIPSGIGPGWVIVHVGKCDNCHSFHVWCWDCGEKFAVGDGTVVTCGCDGREWASVPESPESGHVGQPESVWLMMQEGRGEAIALDRRPIR
jgi:hypothetical protein